MFPRAFHMACALLAAAVLLNGCASTAPYTETEHKGFLWIIGRPAKKNPHDQFAHAKALQDKGKAKPAAKAYRALAIRWPGSEEAAIAQYEYAKWRDSRHELTVAFEEYQKLFDRYAGQFPYDDVLERQFAIAQAVMDKRKGKFLFFGGFKAPERAAPLFESVAGNAPRGPRAAEANYLSGRAYELSDQYELAVVAYLTVQSLYPKSPFAEEASFGRVRSWYKLATESPNDAEALDQAWTAVSVYAATFPASAHINDVLAYKQELYKRRAEAAYQKALFYDKIAHKPESALMTYQTFVKLFPTSEWTSAAQERVKYLSQTVEARDEK